MIKYRENELKEKQLKVQCPISRKESFELGQKESR